MQRNLLTEINVLHVLSSVFCIAYIRLFQPEIQQLEESHKVGKNSE